MENYDYLIVGGGMTAAGAAQAIREVDPEGTIGLISAENHMPYNRPPLTKKLWQGKPEDIIWRELPKQNIHYNLGCKITSLDAGQKQLQDEAGHTYTYKRLLLATGGSPRRLPFGQEDILYYRTLDDYHTVRGWTGQGKRIGVIGGGFIGSETAASLAAIGEQVVMVFPESSIGARVYPADLSNYVTDYFRQKGVELHTETEIQGIERKGARMILQAKGGQKIEVDQIIAGIGIRPNIDLAQAAGISIGDANVGGGILVDEYLRTSQPDIFSAGDVASFYNKALNRKMRVEHADNADTMGKIAGYNMAGRATPYNHLPFFYSDLFDLGYEAVGELDPRLETYADWKEPNRQGVIYYLKDQKVRGVLLWNTWDQVDAARKLISEDRAFKPNELKGRLPEA